MTNTAPQGACTSPPALKVVEGQIVVLDGPAHAITVKDRQGVLHDMVWPAALNGRMEKLKQWWFTKITAELSGDVWKVSALDFFQRPADWPFQKGGSGSGGKSYQPRNEKIIVLQSSLKAAVDLFQTCTTPDTQGYDEACDLVVQKAIEMTDKIMKAGGVQ
jgi:hypothetical protein